MSAGAETPRQGRTKAEVRERLFDLMCENARVERARLTDAASLRDDLRMDSLDLTAVVNEVEHEFKVTIPDKDLPKLKTVGEVVEALWGLLPEK